MTLGLAPKQRDLCALDGELLRRPARGGLDLRGAAPQRFHVVPPMRCSLTLSRCRAPVGAPDDRGGGDGVAADRGLQRPGGRRRVTSTPGGSPPRRPGPREPGVRAYGPGRHATPAKQAASDTDTIPVMVQLRRPAAPFRLGDHGRGLPRRRGRRAGCSSPRSAPAALTKATCTT